MLLCALSRYHDFMLLKFCTNVEWGNLHNLVEAFEVSCEMRRMNVLLARTKREHDPSFSLSGSEQRIDFKLILFCSTLDWRGNCPDSYALCRFGSSKRNGLQAENDFLFHQMVPAIRCHWSLLASMGTIEHRWRCSCASNGATIRAKNRCHSIIFCSESWWMDDSSSSTANSRILFDFILYFISERATVFIHSNNWSRCTVIFSSPRNAFAKTVHWSLHVSRFSLRDGAHVQMGSCDDWQLSKHWPERMMPNEWHQARERERAREDERICEWKQL